MPTLAPFIALSSLLSALAGPAPAEPMHTFELNGYQLSGAEYWPFVGDQPFHYPDDVLWGFYPSDAAEAAISCAEDAYHELESLLAEDPDLLHTAVSLGATARFYLFTNDYTAASEDRTARRARLSHWSGDHDYTRGFWRWEATLTRDGRCLLPDDVQVEDALRDAVEALGGSHFTAGSP